MFQIVLREGITGGFVGPTVKQVVEIRGDDAGASILHANLKEASKSDYTTQTGSLQSDQVQSLAASLKEALAQLPTEQPPGSEDIYGLDIGISYLSDDFLWQNGGPEGCGNGKSEVQASPEQKRAFQAVVQSLVGTGQQFAVQAQD